MTITKLFLFAAVCTLFVIGCTNDKGEDIIKPSTTPTTPGSGCDTASAISYSAQIAPIITSKCISCHGASNGGTKLHDWTNVNAKATSGKLYGAVSWNGSALNMPQGGSKLSDCDIAKVKKWAAAGAPNN
jgi:hypothetical protein